MLLLQSERPLASAEIASQLGLTPRMVRYNLPSIEKWLATKDAQLIKSGYGVSIDAPDRVRRNLASAVERLTGYPLLLSPTERLHLLLLFLLMSDEPLLIKQLQRRLNVSRTTVRRDLERAEEWLERHNLHLLRRPNFGLKVVGKEYDLRAATVDFLIASVGEAHLLALCSGSKTALCLRQGGDIGFWQALSAFLQTLELSYANRLVVSTENAMASRFTDSSHVALTLYLAVLIPRLREGKGIKVRPEHLQDLKERKEFSVARVIAERIERFFGISLPELEIACIAMRLLGAEARRTIADGIDKRGMKDEIAPEVWELVDGILAGASAYLYPSLRVDQELIRSLALHVASALDRIRFDLRTRNPLLEDIKKRYPYIFKVAGKSCAVLADKLGKRLADEEVGYIAMHLVAAMERLSPPIGLRRRVLLVCNAGVATAWLLVSRMRAEFPEVEIVEVMSGLDLQHGKDLNDADVIVSTIPIEIQDIATVVVSPFLSDEDVTRIRQALKVGRTTAAAARLTAHREVGEPSLSDLITAETIRLKVSAGSWREVVYRTGKLLLDIGAIEPRYIEAMREVIIQHGPYMILWPGIALLHALPEQGVRRLCMSMVTLARPVQFGHPENDPVDLAIALGAVDKHQHLKALSELQDLLESEEALDRIRSAIHASQVTDLIASHPWESMG